METLENIQENTNQSNIKAFKAGIWYTISNFFVKGVTFLTTPIFTRLMSKSEFGEFNTYIAWFSIILILTTMDMYSTISRARYDFKDKFDDYISSITITSIILPSIFYIIVLLNLNFFQGIFSMNSTFIHIMFISIIFSSSINIFLTKERVLLNYKSSIFISLVNSLLTISLSILLVFLFEDKALGRVVGQSVPQLIIGFIITIIIFKSSRKISIQHVKYAIKISLPFIAHLLAGNILAQSDRIIIDDILGTEYVAIYSVAYICSTLIIILLNSMNSAWYPWIAEKLYNKQYKEINTISKYYILFFCYVSIMFLLIAPELLLILGGNEYLVAKTLMPPLILGFVFQFFYTLYVNIEMYEKKIWGVAFGTVIAAIINIILNYTFIPKYGVSAAAYTTLIGYIVLFIINYYNVKRMKIDFVFNTKFIISCLFIVSIISFLMLIIYEANLIRYIIFALILMMTIIYIYKNKEKLISYLKNFKKV